MWMPNGRGGTQDRLESRDFYTLDAKIDEVARALGVMDYSMESDVTGYLVGDGPRFSWPSYLKTRYPALGRANQLFGC